MEQSKAKSWWRADMDLSITEFQAFARREDLLAKFALWYAERHEQDPHGYPETLSTGEWCDTFSDFLLAYDPKD